MADQKTAVVTGAQKGIGAAIAEALIDQQINIVMNYLDEDNVVSDLAEKARKNGVKAKIVQADISHQDQAGLLIDAADEFGGVDYLVGNAAVYPRVSLLDMREQDWDQVLSVNLKGSFFVLQAAARKMIVKGMGGSILLLSSGAAVKGAINGAHYSASKSGLFGLAKSAALEFASHDIRTNIIAPGLVDTDQPRGEFSDQDMNRLWQSLPLAGKTLGSDIADLALFLLSDKARRITGQIIHVNGGGLMP